MHTFHDAMINSIEWRAWVGHNELFNDFDVHEAMDSGELTKEHFEAFLRFSAQQYAISILLRFRPYMNLEDKVYDGMVKNFMV